MQLAPALPALWNSSILPEIHLVHRPPATAHQQPHESFLSAQCTPFLSSFSLLERQFLSPERRSSSPRLRERPTCHHDEPYSRSLYASLPTRVHRDLQVSFSQYLERLPRANSLSCFKPRLRIFRCASSRFVEATAGFSRSRNSWSAVTESREQGGERRYA